MQYVALTVGPVWQRLEKLLDRRATRLGLVPELETMGFVASAIIRPRAGPARARQIVHDMATLENCTFVRLTPGASTWSQS